MARSSGAAASWSTSHEHDPQDRLLGAAAALGLLALPAAPRRGRKTAARSCAAGITSCCGWCGTRRPIRRRWPAAPSPISASRPIEAVASGSTALDLARGPAQRPRGPARARAGAEPMTTPSSSIARWPRPSKTFFGNTGPTGQRVMAATEKKLKGEALAGVARGCRRPQRRLWRGADGGTSSPGRRAMAAR